MLFPPVCARSLAGRGERNGRAGTARYEALQLIPGLEIAKLWDCRQLFVVQHQHALDHDLLVVEQQARLVVLAAVSPRMKYAR